MMSLLSWAWAVNGDEAGGNPWPSSSRTNYGLRCQSSLSLAHGGAVRPRPIRSTVSTSSSSRCIQMRQHLTECDSGRPGLQPAPDSATAKPTGGGGSLLLAGSFMMIGQEQPLYRLSSCLRTVQLPRVIVRLYETEGTDSSVTSFEFQRDVLSAEFVDPTGTRAG